MVPGLDQARELWGLLPEDTLVLMDPPRTSGGNEAILVDASPTGKALSHRSSGERGTWSTPFHLLAAEAQDMPLSSLFYP